MHLGNKTTIKESENIISFSQDIIEHLEERAIQELLGGDEKDINNILDIMMTETQAVLTVPGRGLDAAKFDNLDPLAESLEVTLRRESLTFFLLSVMPDFYLNVHHLEWGNLAQMYNKLCIEAARGHGKCLSPETKILMYDGSIKMMKDVVIGDVVMGPDSKP